MKKVASLKNYHRLTELMWEDGSRCPSFHEPFSSIHVKQFEGTHLVSTTEQSKGDIKEKRKQLLKMGRKHIHSMK